MKDSRKPISNSDQNLKHRKKRKLLFIILNVISIIVLAVIGYLYWQIQSDKGSEEKDNKEVHNENITEVEPDEVNQHTTDDGEDNKEDGDNKEKEIPGDIVDDLVKNNSNKQNN